MRKLQLSEYIRVFLLLAESTSKESEETCKRYSGEPHVISAADLLKSDVEPRPAESSMEAVLELFFPTEVLWKMDVLYYAGRDGDFNFEELGRYLKEQSPELNTKEGLIEDLTGRQYWILFESLRKAMDHARKTNDPWIKL